MPEDPQRPSKSCHHADSLKQGEAGSRSGYRGPVLFRQILHEDLACASYLVGDSDRGIAAVVDPQWDIDPYLRLSRLHGVRIEHVLETHNHADHVSGHGRLARATGAHRSTSTPWPRPSTRTRRSATAGRWSSGT